MCTKKSSGSSSNPNLKQTCKHHVHTSRDATFVTVQGHELLQPLLQDCSTQVGEIGIMAPRFNRHVSTESYTCKI